MSKFPSINQEIPCCLVKGYIPGGCDCGQVSYAVLVYGSHLGPIVFFLTSPHTGAGMRNCQVHLQAADSECCMPWPQRQCGFQRHIKCNPEILEIVNWGHFENE